MRTLSARISLVIVLALGTLFYRGYAALHRSFTPNPPFGVSALASPASLLPDDMLTDRDMSFLADRVKHDPDDFVAQNKLAGYYLGRLRETNNLDYLERASRAANASLQSVPAAQNIGGLSALAQIEFASHQFTAARDHAIRWTQLNPDQGPPYGALGDALLELGDYPGASNAYTKLERLGGGVGVQTRLARSSVLHGHLSDGQRRLRDAVALALDLPIPPREAVAWCRWQLGELSFAVGDYPASEHYYRDALTTFPGYFRALASLGRVRAARGNWPEAIRYYEQAVSAVPDPTFVAALGDLYSLAGRKKDADFQYKLVEQIANLSKASGTLYNRQLALFYADHDLHPETAYAHAMGEYTSRKDIYGADTVAWTALKAGRLSTARTAIQAALRLGTQDAKLYYHAGMIALASGDKLTAQSDLKRALQLCPVFDPMQAPIAQRTLSAISVKDASGESAPAQRPAF